MSMRHVLIGAAALFFAALAAPAGAGACGKTPSETVERFHAALLTVMQNADELGASGRFDRLAPEVSKCFDLDLMIRIAAGRHWRGADKDVRERLLDAFRKMSVATYASQFDGYSGETFETIGEKPGPQGTQLVATRINRLGDGPVGLTYVVKDMGGHWRIADVLLDDDVSQLATRRSEYRQVLATQGAEGLADVLERKAQALLGAE